ncbi:MAG TPA: universal stress protein [Candidatus Limnocylindria bacterium]|nr:universal stress protein [Candidatus Limnocylindria bacterium]
MYQRILVPLDGSATAETVLPYVEAFAAGFKTRVELMSVIDLGAMTAHLSADKVPHLEKLIAYEEIKCAEYLKSVAEGFSGISVECRVGRGTPAEAVLEMASKERDTLIAMATHGRSGAKRWLLGSVAEKVLRGTTQPLFLVRAAVSKTSPERIIDSMVVPLDASLLAERILPIVSKWAQALDIEVTLIRAFEFPASAYYSSDDDLPDYDAFLREARKEAADYLKEKADALIGEGVRTVSTLALEGPAAAEIISCAQTAPRAVIAMSTHGRSGIQRWMLGSVTEKVVRHGDDPVLVVRGQ